MENMSIKELQLYNRRILHKNDKRCCYECRKIYDGIRENFHVKKKDSSGKITSWSSNCKDCKNKYHRNLISEYRKDYTKKIKSYLTHIKHRAKELDLPFDLDSDYLVELYKKQDSRCYYTNEIMSFENTVVSKNRPHRYVPSIERLFPEKGYVKGNVSWVCYYVNRMKNDLNLEEFYSLCEKVIEIKNGRTVF